MSDNSERSSPTWRTWVGRMAFAFSVLALLGTSLPRWHVDGKLEGPDRAPSDDQAIRIAIESSHEPSYVRATSYAEHIDDRRCTLGWSRDKKKVECLLPPGSRVKSVAMTDKCQSGGCCSNEPCKPPPDAFLRAKTEVVPIWKKTIEKEALLHVPKTISKDGGHTVVQHLEIGLEGLILNSEITVRGKSEADRLAGWDGKETNVECRGIGAEGGVPLACESWSLSHDSDKAAAITVIVKVTIYGACDTSNGGTSDGGSPDRACVVPPEAAALRIVAAVMKGS